MEPDKEQKNELKIILSAYELLREITRRVGKFPRSVKFTIGDRIINTAFEIFDLLLTAKYEKKKIELLKKTNLELERLRFQIRLCYDEKIINVKQYEFVITMIFETGKMTGGWIKSLKE